jgi:hypothetical protein
MSIRLDPRRVNALKHLAGEAGVRPGDLVRGWIEERIDAARVGSDAGAPAPTGGLAAQIEALVARVAALEATTGIAPVEPTAQEPTEDERAPAAADESPVEASAPEEPQPPIGDAGAEPEPEPGPERRGRPKTKVSAAPTERVALHDEMIAVLREHGPMTAGELASAIADRGRYAPPRSGKPLDAAMVSQRVSNPVYRARFTRNAGRIGLAEPAE